jgi:murein DD-endopeptidase MepM/ murein hydrolase activator NlpD
MVTVAAGDYLSKLASDNGTSYLRVFYANTAISDPDLIFPGQNLRVPEANEELAARELPATAPVEVKQQVVADPAVDTQPVVPAGRQEAPARTPAPRAAVGDGSVWDKLAMCEATGNWAINTGNGFYGGLQFTLSSWQAVGGTGLPSNASREEQIARGAKLQAIQGWGAWPACSAKLGLR